MKNLIILAIALTYGCSSPSHEEQLISDYEQTIFNSRIDLNLEVKRLEYLGPQTGRDSLSLIFSEYQKQLNTSYPDYRTFYDSLNIILRNGNRTVRYVDSLFETAEPEVANYMRGKTANYNQYLQLKKTTAALQEVITMMDVYIERPDEVLSEKYSCTYSIKNPMLNNATQELTKTYYFTPSKDSIITAD